uniref:F-box domain-containing protein n=2 Tax=Mycena chlorophos TaxID=658473 RepID=A0ABQ0MAM7_MYCCL|nr:predicted protein [Mycena chlorophos]
MDFESMLNDDLKARMTAHVAAGLDPVAAMAKAQAEMLANNPFVPPKDGCPVNDLPPELLAHIFALGCAMDDEENEEDEEEDDGEEWETDEEGSDGEPDEIVNEDEHDGDNDVLMQSPKKHSAPLHAPNSDSDDEEKHDHSHDDEHGEEGEDDGPPVPFQVLVSHVCRNWRSVALSSHTLWTRLRFDGHLKPDAAREWLARANGLPLEISIDCSHAHGPHPDDLHGPVPPPPASMIQVLLDQISGTFTTASSTIEAVVVPEEGAEPPVDPCISIDDLRQILALLIPHVDEWKLFEVNVLRYEYMYIIHETLATLPGAPLLEHIGLYNYEDFDTEDIDHFLPAELAKPFVPFQGNVPKLQSIALWAVHLDWDASLSFLRGLQEIEMAYHTKDVRPKAETFRAMITNSPQLEVLSLCATGPEGDLEISELPALKALVLVDIPQDELKPLINSFILPALEDLTLDLLSEDYTEFVVQLVGPAQGSRRSLLAGLLTLKINALSCNDKAVDLFLAQLESVKRKKDEEFLRKNVETYDTYEPSESEDEEEDDMDSIGDGDEVMDED